MSDEVISYEYGDKTILELIQLQDQGHLNLEPGFQRQSVWSGRDRTKLVQSLLEGYPIPSIFLYHREEDGLPVYDVLDGKQRLETIFMFTRARNFGREGFEVKHRFNDAEGADWYDWGALKRRKRSARVLSYKIQTVEVSGPLAQIVDLFVRINSTGKALTGAEKRKARFYTNPFLKQAERLSRRHRRFFERNRILSATQMARMRDVELVSELLASIVSEGPINKKSAIDRIIGNASVHGQSLQKAIRDFNTVVTTMRRLFPELRATRFRNISEFYTLFMVLWELNRHNLILRDRRRNAVANRLLMRFSSGVDAVRELQKRAQGAKRGQQLFADYLVSVQQSTDALTQRKARASIIAGLLQGLFERKDDRRVFSPEQRRLLWNSEERKNCCECGCRLDWNNFQVDHIKAHCWGGKTELPNAALICRSCNASKGARRRRRRAA